MWRERKMDMKKYLDFAFETAVDTIDVGAFGHDDAKKIIITGVKAFLKKNDFEFTDEEIEARAEAGLKGLAVADADFDTNHRDASVNAPKETTHEDILGYAFDSVTATLDLGGFKAEDAAKMAVTGMMAYSASNGQNFSQEEVKAFVAKKMKELAVADADFDKEHRADSVNAPKETTHEDFLEFAFESVTSTLDLGGFRPEDALKMAVTGMKAYAYDNNQKFTNEEIINAAKKKMKEIFGASKDYEYQDWSMPR
jgi:hypothetical protein